jgi:hypothetical protein
MCSISDVIVQQGRAMLVSRTSWKCRYGIYILLHCWPENDEGLWAVGAGGESTSIYRSTIYLLFSTDAWRFSPLSRFCSCPRLFFGFQLSRSSDGAMVWVGGRFRKGRDILGLPRFCGFAWSLYYHRGRVLAPDEALPVYVINPPSSYDVLVWRTFASMFPLSSKLTKLKTQGRYRMHEEVTANLWSSLCFQFHKFGGESPFCGVPPVTTRVNWCRHTGKENGEEGCCFMRSVSVGELLLP